MIAQELAVHSEILDLIDAIEPAHVENNFRSTDLRKKICIYADNRVSPHKIVSIVERNLEALCRYKDHPHSFTKDNCQKFNQMMHEIEKQIFGQTNLLPTDITEERVAQEIELLKNFVIATAA